VKRPIRTKKTAVKITVHPILLERVERLAAARGLYLSELIERLIEEDLKNPRPSLFDAIEPDQNTPNPHLETANRAERLAEENAQRRNKAKPSRPSV